VYYVVLKTDNTPTINLEHITNIFNQKLKYLRFFWGIYKIFNALLEPVGFLKSYPSFGIRMGKCRSAVFHTGVFYFYPGTVHVQIMQNLKITLTAQRGGKTGYKQNKRNAFRPYIILNNKI